MNGPVTEGTLERQVLGGRSGALRTIKIVHTIVWAFLAACIFAIPLASSWGWHRLAAGLAAIVALEVGVLAFNHGRCPLTALAARRTQDRRENFDIYLPEWLAKRNKVIFGTLYAVGTVFALARWAFAAN